MSLGLGQLFGGLLLGQMAGGLLGGKQEEEQPTQMANNSIGGAFQGISNSMFKGMSQEEVYRMGLGFNTLRLEPDQNLATSYESRLKNANATKAKTEQTNQTIQFLANLKSDAYPNGRADLIQLVQAGLIAPLDAVAEARKPPTKESESAIAEQLRMLRDPDVTDFEYATLYPSANQSDLQVKLELIDAATDPETGELNMSDGRMQILGITEPAVYKQQTADLEQMFKDGDITEDEFKEGKLKILGASMPNANEKAPRFEYLHQLATQVNGLTEGSAEYKEFINANIDGKAMTTEINLNDNEDAASAYLKAYLPKYIEESSGIVKEVDIAISQLDKLGDLMDILEADDTGQGVAPYTGIFQPMLTQASRMITSLGIDRKYASEIEAYKNASGEAEKAKARDILYEKLVKTEITKVMTGSDVFPMISSLGIGARGLDTPAERDFLISVMTGLPNMTLDTLKYMTKFRIQMYIDGLEKYNKKVQSGYFKMHNNNQQLMPREVIDLEPLYRYTETGEKIERDDAGDRVITYTQEEYDLIMKGLGGLN
jgi:hypothetical protein